MKAGPDKAREADESHKKTTLSLRARRLLRKKQGSERL